MKDSKIMVFFRKIKKFRDYYRWKKWREKEYVSEENPIIIGGCGRSGTTLFRLMIDAHPQVCIGPESSLFAANLENDWLDQSTGLPNWQTLSHKFDIDIDQIKKMRKKALSQSGFIEKFLLLYAEKNKKKHWGDKTPRNITVMDYIFNHFPKAKFIHVIRDGRDTVCSLRTHPKYRMVNGDKIELNTRNPLNKCIKRWTEEVGAGIKWRGDPRYFEVKYESLVLI